MPSGVLIEVLLKSREHPSDLFRPPQIGVFSERELSEDSVVKKSLTTAADGKSYPTKLSFRGTTFLPRRP
jgi:hypothetical protein